jgi:simple sugar transport system ATP-binding protein
MPNKISGPQGQIGEARVHPLRPAAAPANGHGSLEPSPGERVPLLSLRGITKQFPEVLANDRIDLDVYGGEVHAILGENGAGKSTLMKIIYGFYHPDSGAILLHGKPTHIHSPRDSRRMGIGMVFQNFALIPAMTVSENVALFLPDQGALVSRRSIARRIREVSERYSLEVDPDARLGDLSIGERQKVELIKLMLSHARVLICDEPTSVLAAHEVEGLFRVFEELSRDGYAVLFITHKLQEVLACADRITVLRRGAIVGTALRYQVTAEALVTMMFGSAPPEAARNVGAHHVETTGAALEFRNVTTDYKGHAIGLRDVSLHVMPGEILGVAGVAGNGQEELGETLLGLRRKKKGAILLFGQGMDHWPVAKVLESGVGYIPEDVVGMAAVAEMRVEENLVLGEVHRYSRLGIGVDWKRLHQHVGEALADFPMQLPGASQRLEDLSGGNVQRVVLARELARKPKVLVAYYPTRGLDVRTAEATRGLLLAARDSGGAIVLISEDLDEVMALCDRLIVMHRGEVVGRFAPKNTSVHEIGLLMTGHRS